MSSFYRNKRKYLCRLLKTKGDFVLMSIDAFERREAMINLKEKLLIAEEQRF